MELGIARALLFQVRFFMPRGEAAREGEDLPDPRLRLLMAVFIGATLFAALAAMLHKGGEAGSDCADHWCRRVARSDLDASAPTIEEAPGSDEPDRDVAVTVIGLVLYVAVTAAP